MRIGDVARRKGTNVVTVRSDARVSELLSLLHEHRIGAVVVSDDEQSVTGIVSERDIVRGLHAGGARILEAPVTEIMSREVVTCGPDAAIEEIAALMTNERIRHVPIVSDGRLENIVSIGDVVKSRIDALQSERDLLRHYIQT